MNAGDELRHRVWRVAAGDCEYVLGDYLPGIRTVRQPSSGRPFLLADRPPREVERTLRARSAGLGILFFVLLVIAVLALAGCGLDVSGPAARQEIGWSTRFDTGELEDSAEDLEGLLGETDRAQRWRAELAGFAAMKRGDHPAVIARREGMQSDMDAARALLARIEEIRARGENPPPGVIPDLLSVDDEGREARVRNASDRTLSVHVMRTGTELFQGQPMEFRCYMAPDRHDLDYTKSARLAPGETEAFEVPFDHRCEPLDATGLVFAVFDGDTLVFANESELVLLETNTRLQLGLRERDLERELALTAPDPRN